MAGIASGSVIFGGAAASFAATAIVVGLRSGAAGAVLPLLLAGATSLMLVAAIRETSRRRALADGSRVVRPVARACPRCGLRIRRTRTSEGAARWTCFACLFEAPRATGPGAPKSAAPPEPPEPTSDALA